MEKDEIIAINLFKVFSRGKSRRVAKFLWESISIAFDLNMASIALR